MDIVRLNLKRRNWFLFQILLCFIYVNLRAQNTSEYKFGRMNPTKIIAHTDSSLFVIGKNLNQDSVFDLFISKHHALNKQFDFEKCLNINKVFKGKFKVDNISFEYMQCKNSIVVLFTAVSQENKLLFAKTISFDGVISEAFVIDKTDYTNDNLETCEYSFFQTTKKDILVFVQRSYKSGFKRDKCFLINEKLDKLWERELPKVIVGKQMDSEGELNILADIDNKSNLLYYSAKYSLDFGINNLGKALLVPSFDKYNLKHSVDSIEKVKLGFLTYDLKLRKDSIELKTVNAATTEITSKKIYYPFLSFPIFKSITSSQLLMYNLVDIDDEKHTFPSKVGIYLKRIDIKNDLVLLDTLILLDNKIQENLQYVYGPGSDRATNKNFRLVSENFVDGKLISVFEHRYNEQLLEVLVSSFSVSENKLEWVKLLPRKINISQPNLYDFTVRYFNKQVCVSFYENQKNFNTPLTKYKFNSFHTLHHPEYKNFVSWNISEYGDITKVSESNTTKEFLFPWLSNSTNDTHHFFVNKNFLPMEFLYHNK